MVERLCRARLPCHADTCFAPHAAPVVARCRLLSLLIIFDAADVCAYAAASALLLTPLVADAAEIFSPAAIYTLGCSMPPPYFSPGA